MEKIKVEKILYIFTDENFRDDRYVVGEAQGKYFFSWGKYPENGMVPCEDVAARGAGIRWYDLLSELRREELRDFGEWRVFEETETHGYRFAILVNDLTMDAAWAIWRWERDGWDTDFSIPLSEDEEYWYLDECLDSEKVRALGYRFEGDPSFVEVDDVVESYEDSTKNLRLLRHGSEYAYAWGDLFPFSKEIPHSDVYTLNSGVKWFRSREEAEKWLNISRWEFF